MNLINKKILIAMLDKKQIPYTLTNHKPLHTVSDSIDFRGKIKGIHVKNLFLKNKKNQFFLFSCFENQPVNLKNISKSLNLGNISFANEDLLNNFLGVKPGSVTPFGLLNDSDRVTKFFLDKKIYYGEVVNLHPLENTSTLTISVKDFVKFLIENNVLINIFSFEDNSIIDIGV